VILEALRMDTTHPTADEVFTRVRSKLPRISLATVYRNLETLAASGWIQRLEGVGAQRRFDGNPGKHFHIRCLQCGRVDDVACQPLPLKEVLPVRIEGYDVIDYRVDVLGLCQDCQAPKLPEVPCGDGDELTQRTKSSTGRGGG
jgi:Fur family ferric uptake transcriptional regulator